MLAYVYLLISQFTPVNPGTQIQAYALAPSKHRAPFRHGLEEHSRVAVKGKDNCCKYILHFAIQHYIGEMFMLRKNAKFRNAQYLMFLTRFPLITLV